jgi:hypothetical protein
MHMWGLVAVLIAAVCYALMQIGLGKQIPMQAQQQQANCNQTRWLGKLGLPPPAGCRGGGRQEDALDVRAEQQLGAASHQHHHAFTSHSMHACGDATSWLQQTMKRWNEKAGGAWLGTKDGLVQESPLPLTSSLVAAAQVGPLVLPRQLSRTLCHSRPQLHQVLCAAGSAAQTWCTAAALALVGAVAQIWHDNLQLRDGL